MSADVVQNERLARVQEQAKALPEVFGRLKFDFEDMPERFTSTLGESSQFKGTDVERNEILQRRELIDLMTAYVWQGDPVADAYAALLTKGVSLQRLIQMLVEACDKGGEAVPGAPDELRLMIAEMERRPDWVDMGLVEAGARIERNMCANMLPYVTRGAFLTTFLNKYTALPMALTGTLSNATARRRAFETTSWAMTTALPGSLERFGPGFKVSAMVRLMHSMVRVNVLTRSNKWDPAVYGMPIPQVDQIGAGLGMVFFLSQRAVRQGRKDYTRQERARVEFHRYRCFLLGLPEELLPDTPQGIVDMFAARSATLRHNFDDEVCMPLVRSMLEADLATDRSAPSRFRESLSNSFGKLFFLYAFGYISREVAERLGYHLTFGDKLKNVATGALVGGRMAMHGILSRIPLLSASSDRALVRRIQKWISRYGHTEFVSDGGNYRPKVADARAD